MHKLILVHVTLSDPLLLGKLLLLVPGGQDKPERDDHKHKQHVAAHVRGKGDEVPRRIAAEENLRADGVADAPGDEVHGDDGGLFGLACDVAREKGHGERLRGPEGEYHVVGDEEPGLGCFGVEFYGHQDNGADEGSGD